MSVIRCSAGLSLPRANSSNQSSAQLNVVSFGQRNWAPVIPKLELPSADPPSVVAGGYCVFGLVATLTASRLRVTSPADALCP